MVSPLTVGGAFAVVGEGAVAFAEGGRHAERAFIGLRQRQIPAITA